MATDMIRTRLLTPLVTCGALMFLSACTPAAPQQPEPTAAGDARVPWASSYSALPSTPTLIRNATVMTAAGPALERTDVLMRDGRIVEVGSALAAPADATVVDGSGKFVTPGLIDTHSHLGVYAAPGGSALSDGNEATDPSSCRRATGSRRRPSSGRTARPGTSSPSR